MYNIGKHESEMFLTEYDPLGPTTERFLSVQTYQRLRLQLKVPASVSDV